MTKTKAAKTARKKPTPLHLVSTASIERAAAKHGLTDNAILARLRAGWSVAAALNTPRKIGGRPRVPSSLSGKARAAGITTLRGVAAVTRRVNSGTSTPKAIEAVKGAAA